MRDSKITFRASEDLIERVDEIDESRSEVMREALRAYLEGSDKRADRRERDHAGRPTLDDVLRGMIRETVEDVVDEAVEKRLRDRERDNVNVTVNVPDAHGGAHKDEQLDATRETESAEDDVQRRTVKEPVEKTGDGSKTCPQCGEEVADEHVHCPNCGAKTAQRLFCDCGDEIRSDWSFCPSCGRRTPTSHALRNE